MAQGNPLRVCIATSSVIKVEAVKAALKKAYPEREVVATTFDVDSEINAQPVGFDETRRGAKNRIKNAILAMKSASSTADLVVAIENGIVDTGGLWFDFGLVIVQNFDGLLSEGISAGVAFQNEFVMEAKQLGFAKTTVGDVMARHLKANTKDPHSTLTKGLLSRQALLESAILIAVANHI